MPHKFGLLIIEQERIFYLSSRGGSCHFVQEATQICHSKKFKGSETQSHVSSKMILLAQPCLNNNPFNVRKLMLEQRSVLTLFC